jgi:hypothetical protein
MNLSLTEFKTSITEGAIQAQEQTNSTMSKDLQQVILEAKDSEYNQGSYQTPQNKQPMVLDQQQYSILNDPLLSSPMKIIAEEVDQEGKGSSHSSLAHEDRDGASTQENLESERLEAPMLH